VPELTTDEKGALAEKIIQRDPKSGVEQLAILREFEANAQSRANGYPKDTVEQLGAARLCSVIRDTAAQQEQVNTIVGDLDPQYGGVFCMPGQGILCTGPLTEIFGEKPLATLSEFTQKYEELKSQVQQRAAEVLKESAVQMKEKIKYLNGRITDLITSEKTNIKIAIDYRKDSGWFGALSRGLTKSDPYEIEIINSRRKVATMQDIVIPMIQEAEVALNSEPPDITLARKKLEAATEIQQRTTAVDTDQSHFEVEQEALSVTENVSIAAILTLPTLGVGGMAAGGTKIAVEGTKLAYHGITKGMTYLTIGTAAAGGASALLRSGEEPQPTEKEQKQSSELAKIAELPLAEKIDLIGNKLLNQIPDQEGYTFSPELLSVVMNQSTEIARMFLEYTAETDIKKREEILLGITGKIEDSSGDIMQQFLNDNVDETTSKRFTEAREDRKQNDTLRIGKIVGQVYILEALSRGDEQGAFEAARQYVQNDIIGIQEEDVPPATTKKVIDDMAKSILAVTQSETYPMVVNAIQAYSKTGFTESFKTKVGGLTNFVGDVVSAPFDEEASKRVTKGYTAISTVVSEGKGGDLVMGLISFAKTACNVAIDHVQALDLLETLGGSMALDALIIAGTMGAGAAVNAAEEAGKISEKAAKGVNIAAKVATIANSTINNTQKPHTFSKPITLAGLNARLSKSV
jgi:hypothetical protein